MSLDKFMQGEEGLDDVLISLAEKWDSLDTVTQRYIATQAAGSRQQSRFIALMSDYKRTIELTTAATTAAGASAEQYDKTLESFETHLNNLKNAWQTFTMNLTNNDLLKGIMSIATKILETINNINNSIQNSGTKSIVILAEILTAAGLLSVGLHKLKTALLEVAIAEMTAQGATTEATNAFRLQHVQVSLLSGSFKKLAEKGMATIFNILVKLEAVFGTTAAAVGALVGILAAAAAVILVVVKAAKTAQNLGAEKSLKTITDTLNTLNEQLDETKTELDSINASLDSIQSAEDTLKTLTVGTEAWYKQLEVVNSQINDLISEYPELAKYFEQDINGNYTLTEENREAFEKDYQKKISAQEQAVAFTNIEKNNASARLNIEETSKNIAQAGSFELVKDFLTEATSNAEFDFAAALKDPSVIGKFISEAAKQTYIQQIDPTSELTQEQQEEQLENVYSAIMSHSDEIQTLIGTNNSLMSANNILLKNYLDKNTPGVEEGNAGYVSEKIQKTMAADTTNYAQRDFGTIHGRKEAEGMLQAALGDSGLTVTKNKNGEYTAVTSDGRTLTYNRDQLESVYNEWARFEAAKKTLEITEDSNKVNDEANAIRKEFNAATGNKSNSVSSAFATQVAKLQTGEISELDLSGVNYKDILAMDTGAFTDATVRAKAEAEKQRWTKSNNLATPVIAALGYDESEQQDLITRIHNNQQIFDSGDMGEIAQALADNFTQAEISTLNVGQDTITQALHIKRQANLKANQEAKEYGYNNKIADNSNAVLLSSGLSTADQENLTNTISELNPKLKENETLLNAVAASTINTATGLAAVNEAYADNKDVIGAANKTSVEYWTSLSTLATKFNTILGTSIDSKFIDEHLGLLQDALNGDTDALIALMKAAADADLKKLALDEEDQKALEEAAKTTISGYTQAAGTSLAGGIFAVLDKLLESGAIDDTLARTIGRKYGGELTDNGWQALGSSSVVSGMSSALVGQSIDYLKGQYNSLFKIEQLQAKLNKAQITYNRLLNNGNKSSRTRIKLLKDQMDYNAAMSAEYETLIGQQEDAIAKFLKNDTSGNFAYDFDTGLATISENASTEAREEFEELVSTLNGYIESEAEYAEANTETKKQATDTYYSLIEDTAQMLQESDQKKIDLLQDQLDAEKDAAEKLINSIQANFTQLRQDRENEEKESDINTLTRRIAYLRQDTSGSNALQIKELEKELAEQTQDYEDNLIDQSLEDLSEQQDEAFDQRQQQIDNQESMIEWMANYGTYNKQATDIVTSSIKALEDGESIQYTQLGELITNTSQALTSGQLSQKLTEYTADLEEASLFDYKANADKMGDKFPALKSNPVPVKDSSKSTDDDDNTGSGTTGDSKLKQLVKKYYDDNKDSNISTWTTEDWDDLYSGFTIQAKNLGYSTSDTNKAWKALQMWLKYDNSSYYESLDEDLGLIASILSNIEENTENTAQGVEKVSGENDGTAEYYEKNKLTGTASNGTYYVNGVAYKESTGTKNSDGTTSYSATDTVPTSSSKLKTGDTVKTSSGSTLTYVAGSGWIRGEIIKYATGGLSTTTGPAWLDGTKSNPELVLNAQDTKNFLELKDILRDWQSQGKLTNAGTYAFDVSVNVDSISSDYDVDELTTRIEKNITDAMKYRNNIRTNRTK